MKNVILFFLFISTSLAAQSLEEDLTLTTDTGNIEGSLLCPKAKKQVPLVLIIAGSGPTDRNGNNALMENNSLKMLAEGLAENEIASLRFDKRGIAKSASSGIEEIDLRFETMIYDVEAWIDMLSKDKRFSEIVVLGHSEGSTIGMIASQKKEVGKYISLAGPGVKASEKIKEQLSGQAPFLMDQAVPILDSLEWGYSYRGSTNANEFSSSQCSTLYHILV